MVVLFQCNYGVCERGREARGGREGEKQRTDRMTARVESAMDLFARRPRQSDTSQLSYLPNLQHAYYENMYWRLEMDQKGGAGCRVWVNVLTYICMADAFFFVLPAVFFLLRQSGIY